MKNKLKSKFPKLLLIYYKIRFYIRAIYILETRAHLKWKIISGDRKIHKKYPLNSNSIFFDIGGFEGGFSEKIIEEFDCFCYIFEPHPEFFKVLENKFDSNSKVFLFNFGLSDSNKNLKLSDESASSKLTDSNEGYLVSVRDISEVIDELKLKNIDLLKSNIEGAEYDLLSRLIETNKISIINSLQIQYHKDHIQNAEILRAKINDKLLDTHKNIWSYYFVWERWDLNN
tara:strand:- start:1313 stop:1999 length:687 start_codon:yes stop_codon:yes gene_type:complete